jgi:hyperosmotically inducible protein
MKAIVVTTCMMVGTLLGSTTAAIAQDASTDLSQATTFLKDSAITAKIKSKLAAEHVTSLERVHVDTDKNGVVWLSGSAPTQEAADKVVAVARDTERVTDVRSDIKVHKVE